MVRGSGSSVELWGREKQAHLVTARVLDPSLYGSEWQKKRVMNDGTKAMAGKQWETEP